MASRKDLFFREVEKLNKHYAGMAQRASRKDLLSIEVERVNKLHTLMIQLFNSMSCSEDGYQSLLVTTPVFLSMMTPELRQNLSFFDELVNLLNSLYSKHCGYLMSQADDVQDLWGICRGGTTIEALMDEISKNKPQQALSPEQKICSGPLVTETTECLPGNKKLFINVWKTLAYILLISCGLNLSSTVC